MNANIYELAQTLFEEAGDALFLFDPTDGRIVEVNPVAQRLSAMTRPALLQETVETLFRSEMQGGLNRLRRACKVTGVFHSQDGFLLRQRHSGNWVPVNVTVTRLHARPKTLGLITARDVTERRQSEAALREKDQSYGELFENAVDFIYTADLAGKITSINAAAERLTGYARGDLLGKNIAELIAPEYRDVSRQMFDSTCEHAERVSYDVEILTKDGNRITLEVCSQLICRDDKPVGFLGIARDVRERRLLEDQLRQAQKMEAVGQLAGGVAHDFNNLLTVISGYSEFLLDTMDPSVPECAPLKEIHEAAKRAAVLTRQLLAFSRRQILQTAVVDLNCVVADTVKMLGRLIGEHIEIITNFEPELSPVRTDAGQVSQAVINLAVNARDAMTRGGKLTIGTSTVYLDEAFVASETDLQPGWYVCVSVADTGTGIEPKTLARIFEPFFTTKAVGKGTGLGLAMVYGFVKQANGHITVESEVGRGTTFRIFLTAQRSGQSCVQDAVPEIQPETGTELILLVEDEAGVRELARAALQSRGYAVLEACHGLDALRVIEQSAGQLDLLLTDVVMPQMGGRELAERLAVTLPDLKVLYLTGYTDDALLRDALRDGTPYLQKPFTPRDLARKVREVLNQSSACEPAMA